MILELILFAVIGLAMFVFLYQIVDSLKLNKLRKNYTKDKDDGGVVGSFKELMVEEEAKYQKIVPTEQISDISINTQKKEIYAEKTPSLSDSKQ